MSVSVSKVALTVRLRCAEGKKPELLAGLTRILEATRREAGTEIYMILESAFDDSTVWVVELYTDEAAYIAHRASPVHRALEEELGGLLDGTAMLSFLKPVGMKLPGEQEQR